MRNFSSCSVVLHNNSICLSSLTSSAEASASSMTRAIINYKPGKRVGDDVVLVRYMEDVSCEL